MASRFGGGDDMCGAWIPYAWINFPDQAGFWWILSRGIFKGMKLFFFFKRKCQYKYEIETFLLRSSSIITIVIFMCKFYNFIISRTMITFNNISTIHKNIFILSNRTYFFFLSSCKIKLFEIGFSAKLREFRKIFSPDVKIRYPRFHNLPQKGYRIFFPGRKVEHWGWGRGREDSYRPTFSTNTFDAATRRNVLASGLTIIVYFTSSTGHSSVSALHRTSRGDNFFPAAHPFFPPPKNHYDRFGQWSIDLLRTRGDSV